MKAYLRDQWERLRTSYWFIPSAMMLVTTGFSFLIVEIDRSVRLEQFLWLKWIYFNDADGARAILSTIAGSMITVAGVVFSITIVVLTLASNQFGPRLLRSFMRDRGNQVVLGTFTATYLYCLLVIRSIAGKDTALFVPHLAVNFGILLAIIGLVVLIYYIHHTASSIQAVNVIDKVNLELQDTINRLFPDALDHDSFAQDIHPGPDMPLIDFPKQSVSVPATQNGYIQAINNQRLIKLAQRYDVLIYIPHRPGGYLIPGAPLADVWPCEHLQDDLSKAINKSFLCGLQPTPQEDAEFAIRQLVELALRALSPGINDPFTAINCIDRLTAGLAILVTRQFPSPYYYDKDSRLRLITHAITFPAIVDEAFNQLRQYGCSSVAVMNRLLESITMIAPLAKRSADRQSLSLHAIMIADESLRHIKEQHDRVAVSSRRERVMKILAKS